MKSNVVVGSFVLLCGITLSSPSVADPSAADQMAAAVESWRAGDFNGAHEQLTQMMEDGTRDARVYYYRALISEHLGSDSDEDLQAAAKLEAETTRESSARKCSGCATGEN